MSATTAHSTIIRRRVRVQIGPSTLMPRLTVPERPRALVLVPSASGDRTYEGVNRVIAVSLWQVGFATLEADLLTREEAIADAETSAARFDVDLIGARTAAVLTWAHQMPAVQELEIGAFAAGPCAAGVLVAAAERPDLIQSVVCRSARPELAAGALAYVSAPVLLLLGERDTAHNDEHRMAMTLLPPRSRLEIIPGARHLLDRPADILRVAQLSACWLGETLTSRFILAGASPVRNAGW
jgi:putative phosphoribosyl transferase